MSKGNRTKNKIALIASELINNSGYHGMALSDLMNATGLKKGGIYNHFVDKEEIALKALDVAFINVLERIKERFDQTGDAKNKLLSLIQVFASYASEPILKGHFPLIGMGIHAESLGPEYHSRVLNAQTKLEYFIQVLLTEGVETNLFFPHLNIPTSSKYIGASLYGGLFCASSMQNQQYMDIVCAELQGWVNKNLK